MHGTQNVTANLNKNSVLSSFYIIQFSACEMEFFSFKQTYWAFWFQTFLYLSCMLMWTSFLIGLYLMLLWQRQGSKARIMNVRFWVFRTTVSFRVVLEKYCLYNFKYVLTLNTLIADIVFSLSEYLKLLKFSQIGSEQKQD